MLNKNDGLGLGGKNLSALAMSGALVVGDNSISNGAAGTDVVRYLQDNQLPDYQAGVTVNGTGLFDLNGNSDVIGTADGQPALSVTSGVVATGVGTLTINGNITATATFNIGTLPANNAGIIAPVISGKLNLGDIYASTITVNDQSALLVDAIISASLSGAADVIKQTAGTLLLTGNSTGLTGNFSINNNPGFNQPSLIVGGSTAGVSTALGTGIIFPASGVQIASAGGARSLANRFIVQSLSLAGGNDLSITRPVDLIGTTNTITVFAPVNLTLAGGLGEVTPGLPAAKAGAGFLNLTAPSTFSGSLTVNPAGGSVMLSGGGTLPNVASITVGMGGSLNIDNLGVGNANSDRVRNSAAVSLAGGSLNFRGNASAAVNEILGSLTINSNFTSIVSSTSQGQLASLSFNSLTRQINSDLAFRGYGQDLGSANNQIFFYTPLTSQLSNGILSFATLAKAGDLDFVTYDPSRGIFAAPFRNSLTGATAYDNVKLTANSAVASPTTINALLISGNGITVSGASQLTVGTGLIVSSGLNNAVNAPIAFGGVTGLIVTPTFASGVGSNSLSMGAIDGQQGIAKLGPGRATFTQANTYSGITNILEGASASPTAVPSASGPRTWQAKERSSMPARPWKSTERPAM